MLFALCNLNQCMTLNFVSGDQSACILFLLSSLNFLHQTSEWLDIKSGVKLVYLISDVSLSSISIRNAVFSLLFTFIIVM